MQGSLIGITSYFVFLRRYAQILQGQGQALPLQIEVIMKKRIIFFTLLLGLFFSLPVVFAAEKAQMTQEELKAYNERLTNIANLKKSEAVIQKKIKIIEESLTKKLIKAEIDSEFDEIEKELERNNHSLQLVQKKRLELEAVNKPKTDPSKWMDEEMKKMKPQSEYGKEAYDNYWKNKKEKKN